MGKVKRVIIFVCRCIGLLALIVSMFAFTDWVWGYAGLAFLLGITFIGIALYLCRNSENVSENDEQTQDEEEYKYIEFGADRITFPPTHRITDFDIVYAELKEKEQNNGNTL